jgi:hypothetical protein
LTTKETPIHWIPHWSVPRMAGVIVVTVFLIVVAGGAWLRLRHVELCTRERTGDSLRIVAETTHELLRALFDAEKETWSKSPVTRDWQNWPRNN